MLFPGGHPILVFNGSIFRFWQGLNLTKMPESFLQFLPGLLHIFINNDISIHPNRTKRSSLILRIVKLDLAGHHNTLGYIPVQNFGNSFCQLIIYQK